MKTSLLILATIVSCPAVFSQVTTETTNKQTISPATEVATPTSAENNGQSYESRQNGTVTISKRAGEEQRTHDEAYYNEEIAKVDNHIASINTKIDYMNADAQRKAEAEQNGWFDQMNQFKSDLEAKKADLIQKRDSL